MTEGQPPAPQKGLNPTLKWVLIGCGTLMLLAILAAAGIGYFVYHKAQELRAEMAAKGVHVDTSHGFQGMAYGMTVNLVRAMEPAVLMALPKDEHPAADKAFTDLAAKGPSFTGRDMHDLDAAMRDYNAANKALSDAGKPPFDTAAARTFVKAIQAIADRH
jgi:hypothetical protein